MTQRPEQQSPLGWLIRAPFDLLIVVTRRLLSHFGMMMALAVGFTVAITLVVAIPVYAEAVGYRVLKTELSRRDNGSQRPPFAFMYRYLGNIKGLLSWQQYAPLDRYMREQMPNDLGLPVEQTARYTASDKLPMLPADGSGTTLMWVQYAFADGIDQHVELVDGRLPQPTASGPVEVMIAEELASEAGFQVGEEYLVLGPKSDLTGRSQPFRIVGIWRATDSADPYWFYLPSAFKEVLLLPEQTFQERIAANNPEVIYVALWYVVTDGSGIRSADVPDVSGRILRSVAEANSLQSGAGLDLSPLDALISHQRQVQRLTVSLTIFSVPIFLLIAYFVILVAGLVVQRQSNEISVLRSRGASRTQVMVVYLFEALLLGLLTLGLGLILGQGAALVMVWTRSFLALAPAEPLPIALTREAWQRAFQMLGLMTLASLLPAFGAARYTIVSFRAERARTTRPPFWQRAWLDVLLLVPVGYAYYLLRQNGPGVFSNGENAADPFANPLLLLAPTLAICACSLLAVRLFPLLMRIAARVAVLMPGIAALIAFRSMARAPTLYTRPLLLMLLTLSLATFTASMAATLDDNLIERAFYDTGAVMRVSDYGQSTQLQGPPGFGQPSGPVDASSQDKIEEAQYLFLPVSEYLTVPGVEGAARVGRSNATADGGNFSGPVTFLGIDRVDLTGVVDWRNVYAGESLGALLNRIGDDPAQVIASTSLAARGVRAGDKITLQLADLGEQRAVSFVVAGFTTLFPTLYPEDEPFIIGNLEYAFEQQGGQYPYEVWLKLNSATTPEVILSELAALDLRVADRGYAPEVIVEEQRRPERQGVFGLLSVGFAAAALLTAIGFFFYALVMFQRRFVELGTLRAIGLGVGQLGTLLGWEQGTLIVSGLIGGTLIGVVVSRAFIPFLQVRGGDHPLTPPFVVQIAWGQIGFIYTVFSGVLVVITLITMVLLRRMRLFEAVKMGEAI